MMQNYMIKGSIFPITLVILLSSTIPLKSIFFKVTLFYTSRKIQREYDSLGWRAAKASLSIDQERHLL